MKKTITAEEFDRKFDDGEDISEFLDWENARRPGLEVKRVNVDFPAWMLKELDKEAARLNIPRQAVVKIAVDGFLQNASHKGAQGR